jgi:hypothetical protein
MLRSSKTEHMLRVVQFVDIFICHADEGAVKTEAKLT